MDEIDKSINHLEKDQEGFNFPENNLRLANNKAGRFDDKKTYQK